MLPVTFDRERVLAVALEGRPLKEIAATAGIPVSQLFKAMEDAPFRAELIQARDSGIDVLVDEIMTIAKDESIPVDRARLMCENIKWIAARRAHRRYGDRIDMNVNGSIDIGSTLIEARQRITQPVCNQQTITDYQVIDTQGKCVRESTDKESDTDAGSIFD